MDDIVSVYRYKWRAPKDTKVLLFEKVQLQKFQQSTTDSWVKFHFQIFFLNTDGWSY